MASQGDHVDSARILLYHKAPVDDVTVVSFINFFSTILVNKIPIKKNIYSLLVKNNF